MNSPFSLAFLREDSLNDPLQLTACGFVEVQCLVNLPHSHPVLSAVRLKEEVRHTALGDARVSAIDLCSKTAARRVPDLSKGPHSCHEMPSHSQGSGAATDLEK